MPHGDRLYMFLFGSAILWGLYLDRFEVIYVLVAIAMFEALTNWRLSHVFSRLIGEQATAPAGEHARFAFEAARAWRLLVSAMLCLSAILFFEQLWFLAWFIGFAVAGAGISGVCPLLIMFQRLGFR